MQGAHVIMLSRTALSFTQARNFSLSACVCGRRSRVPYDRRFGPHPKDVGPHKPGGNKWMSSKLGKELPHYPQFPGYFDKRGRPHIVPEMIPEFVVPDLKGFTLKPYVSYKVSEVTQSEFTAKDLFDAVYSKDIVKDFETGNVDVDYIEKKFPSKEQES